MLAAFFILPVRGDPDFGRAVHLPGANLHFQRLAMRAEHLGMQRLVHIRLRFGDIVGEHIRQRQPHAVHLPEHGVAGLYRIDDHADRFQVEDLAEIHAPAIFILL